ncbi:MAG: HlyD family efflux transporter periplasmic adaptor subunit [Planctomycetia bacterium]|nr:HlyD family efflux transporter periplasmic adaptor subunit [Planctomycetia bacterium]
MMLRKFSRCAAFAARNLIYSLVALLLLAGLALGLWHFLGGGTSKQSSLIQIEATRGTFRHEINGKGSAESTENVDIASQVEGSATVIWIIPEGETVKEGDDLVLLDSSSIEDKLNSQQITFNTSSANVASSQATLRTAELSLEEYVEGTFEQSWTTTENSIFTAKETQKQKADSVRFSERLVQLGYTTPAQLEVDRVDEQKQVNTVKLSLLEQKVLLKYSSEKKITELMSAIETARANVASNTYTNLLDKNRLEYYRTQFENCTIKAPQDGQVVYANQDNRRWMSESDVIKEGATVRERQVLIRLPDPNQMQVKAMINEANISSVQVGMKAKIKFDAISSREFSGTVIKVNQYPEMVFMSSAKDYITIIKIDDSSLDIRSGLTAEVRILAQEEDNVMLLPIHCIVESGGKTFVLKTANGAWSCKEVLLGASNDKQVIIRKGLEDGESVVSGARLYKSKVTFPDATVPSLFAQEKEKNDLADDASSEQAPEGATASEGMTPGQMPKGPLPEGMTPGQMPKGPMPEGMTPGQMPKGPLPEGMTPDQMPREHKDEKGNSSSSATEVAQSEQLQELEKQKEQLRRIQALTEYFPRTAMEFCRDLDPNRDKVITRGEVETVASPLLGFYDEWDRNGDGTLSHTDLVIGFCTCRNLWQKSAALLEEKAADQEEVELDPNRELTPQDFVTASPDQLFKRLDVDQNGTLEMSEIPDQESELVSRLLTRLDSDEDGTLSRDEFTKGISLMQKRMKGGLSNGANTRPAGGNAPPRPPR